MGLSGFLYVAIVVGWAVYLVPFALKRYDEAARNRSVERFSSAMRVLGRRDTEPTDAAAQSARATPGPAGSSRGTQSDAARTAARRRRRVLLLLVFATAVTSTLAALATAPLWSIGIPAGLVVLWLLLCRTQARRERRRARDARTARTESRGEPADEEVGDHVHGAGTQAGGATQGVQVRAPEADAVDVSPTEVPADDEPTVVLSRDALAEAEEQYAGSGSLWDPVPVTLPTYVHKPRAPRTIRTIDLGAPDVQTSGRTEAGAAEADRAQAASHAEPPDRTAGTASAAGAACAPGADGAATGSAAEAEEHVVPTGRAVGE